MQHYITLLCICIFAYLLGSIPFGLLFVKIFKSIDLRETGSGNIGATNARRAGGWKLGLATLVCDVLKGAIPVFIMSMVDFNNDKMLKDFWMSLACILAFSGHLFPVYLKFKTGGKGVATAAGCFSVLSLPALIIAIISFVIVVSFSKRVSAGSISAAALLPVMVFFETHSVVTGGCAGIISLMIIVRHKENIKRLLAGTEPTI